MRKPEQFGVFVFHTETECFPLQRADDPGESATFRTITEALKEMNERRIDYGIRTEIVDLDSNTVVLETADEGKTWSAPERNRRPAALTPA